MFANYSEALGRLVLVAAVASGLVWSAAGLPRTAQAQTPDPATQLYVDRIAVNFASVGGAKRLAIAFVDIVDGNGSPVNGALVVGDWSGCFKQLNDSAVTETVCHADENGTVNCVDGETWIWANKAHSCWGKNKSCQYIFTITNVSKEGMTYVPVEGMTSSWTVCR